MSDERCVCCGEQVPEGRQVCPKCEKIAPAGAEAACNVAVRRAVKEFADRVKLEFGCLFDEEIPPILNDRIDEIAKEITGDNHDSN